MNKKKVSINFINSWLAKKKKRKEEANRKVKHHILVVFPFSHYFYISPGIGNRSSSSTSKGFRIGIYIYSFVYVSYH